MFHPAESYEQVDDEQRILVMSPLYYDNEDKIQEEYYKDVRKPSTLQSWQHHPATSVDKKLVDGRRPVSDLPAPGDPHTSDSAGDLGFT